MRQPEGPTPAPGRPKPAQLPGQAIKVSPPNACGRGNELGHGGTKEGSVGDVTNRPLGCYPDKQSGTRAVLCPERKDSVETGNDVFNPTSMISSLFRKETAPWLPTRDTRLPDITQRLERIRGLHNQAVYPMDTVGNTLARSQLAQVEVPWLLARLDEAMLQIMELETGR